MTHASLRAEERYGLPLTDADLTKFVLDITDTVTRTRTAALLQRRQPDGREVWLVRARCGIAMRVVYAPQDAAVVTVLPWGRE